MDGIWVAAWWIVCAILAIAYAVISVVMMRYRAKKEETFVANVVAGKKVFSPERYSKMEAYEMTNGSSVISPQRPGRTYV